MPVELQDYHNARIIAKALYFADHSSLLDGPAQQLRTNLLNTDRVYRDRIGKILERRTPVRADVFSSQFYLNVSSQERDVQRESDATAR